MLVNAAVAAQKERQAKGNQSQGTRYRKDPTWSQVNPTSSKDAILMQIFFVGIDICSKGSC
jgi:glutathione synthase/RimK-type ligase-like ATP-grasp enzyme